MPNLTSHIDPARIARALRLCMQACANGGLGYRAAANDARDADLSRLLRRYSRQRVEFALQLQSAIQVLGGGHDEETSTSGTLHRVWFRVRLAIEGRSEAVVLEECARGDSAALQTFDRAFTDILPKMSCESRMLIRGQYGAIRSSLSEIERRLLTNVR